MGINSFWNNIIRRLNLALDPHMSFDLCICILQQRDIIKNITKTNKRP